MTEKSTYWLGPRLSEGKRWAYATSATILTGEAETEEIYRMYRRYVKQWNDIELDTNRCLSEHTHEIFGAKVIGGANRRFILHWQKENQVHWILEIFFSRGFREYYPGLSCGRNSLRSTKDIRSIRLHWSGDGREEFNRWLVAEKAENKNKGEWDEYKA